MSLTDGDDALPRQFLVVTGSSAGGIDALTSFVSALPSDFPAPVVVAQHLSPKHRSRLETILASHTQLRIETVEHDAKLVAGSIYCVPPGHDVQIVDSTAEVRVQLKPGPKPSIDRFFESAADVYGDRTIAIVFSGLGSDGAKGARVVKDRGGTVIIQEPSSAGYPAMPLSIPPTIVDISAAPDEMGRVIADMIASSNGNIHGENGETMLRALLSQLRERSGIDFSSYKTPTIMRRLSRVMVAAGRHSVAEYMTHLQSHPADYQKLVNSFLIKVTEFFRDEALFSALRTKILPELIAQAKEAGRDLRIWSAGSSTGEEPYSLAILCAELTRNDSSAPNVRIFATDLDEGAIGFARRGVYGRDALSDLPSELLKRYFMQHGDQFEVSKQIRNMTVFGQHDLAQRAPFPRIDLVLCRNVLIYFTKDLQSRVLQLFAFALRDQGFLVLGKAESTTPLPKFFTSSDSVLKIYRREGERLIIPPRRLSDDHRSQAEMSTMHKRPIDSMPSGRDATRIPSHEIMATYIAASVVGVIVVDKNYDIVAINSAARAMFQIHGVGVGSDLIHLLPKFGASLRTMIDATLDGEGAEPEVLLAKDPVTGIDRWLQMFCTSQQRGAAQVDTVGIVAVDVTRYERRLQEDHARIQSLEAALREATGRAEDLSLRARSMLAANEELSATNTELRTYNEQLLINAEEAASSSEEIETLNEEMQATNEELETLNEELQATVEELNTTNDELEARGAELLSANSSNRIALDASESQRAGLTAAVDHMLPGCAIVTPDGQPVYLSPRFSDLAAVLPAKDWWKEPATVKMSDGETFATQIAPLHGGLVLITLKKSS